MSLQDKIKVNKNHSHLENTNENDSHSAPEAEAKPAPELIHVTYAIERRGAYFHTKIMNIYNDGTWKHVGYTDLEPLPYVFARLEKLMMKGKKL